MQQRNKYEQSMRELSYAYVGIIVLLVIQLLIQ